MLELKLYSAELLGASRFFKYRPLQLPFSLVKPINRISYVYLIIHKSIYRDTTKSKLNQCQSQGKLVELDTHVKLPRELKITKTGSINPSEPINDTLYDLTFHH